MSISTLERGPHFPPAPLRPAPLPFPSKADHFHPAAQQDAFALLLCLHHPALNLVGVSTVYGNAPLDRVTDNAARLLNLFARPEVPIFPGVNRPFVREAIHAPDIHGESGLDTSIPLPPPSPLTPSPPTPPFHHLPTYLLSLPPTHPGLSIIATGALTNVALLLSAFPHLHSKIASLTIMGGCIGSGFTTADLGTYTPSPSSSSDLPTAKPRLGNITPFAEFNIHTDPDAAAAIFTSPFAKTGRVVLVPLDVTHLVRASPDAHTALVEGPKTRERGEREAAIRPVLGGLLDYFNDSYARVFGLVGGGPVHDGASVGAVLEDGWLSFGEGEWEVEVLREGEESGRTVVRKVEGGRGVRIPVGADQDAFWREVEGTVVEAERRARELDDRGVGWA
ncbi:MAG: Uridine nucleosidase 1 [Vezdaea aestivalis]|nr:MAG: Uridine nucleosidase 1 [Vezdaea aestivalis]